MKKLSFLLALLIIMQVNSYAQIEEGSFEFEGKIRNYAVFLPQNFEPNMPVVITLHGWNETLEWCMNYIDMNSVADTMGFVVVYPAAISPGFNSGCIRPPGAVQALNVNDVGFISNLIDTIHIKYGIDLKRVYCCGLSNGGNMAHKIASQLGYRFAAVADVLGAMNDRIANDYYKIRSLPILICHGTADILCPYNGDASRQQWSTEETVNFWLENNGCVLEADTVSLPDINTLDGCTIDKISYRNCEDSTVVVFYKGINMGHSWPGSASTFPAEGNINRDINANVEVLNFFRNYENPFVNLSFGKSIETYPKYIKPGGDTLKITAAVYNPEDHPVIVNSKIIAEGHSYQDSIQLFDNGLHNYYGYKWLSNLEEDFYTAELYTSDLDFGKNLKYYWKEHFTTAGPLKLDSVSYTKNSNRHNYSIKSFVRNDGNNMTIKNAEIKLYCNDPWVGSVSTGNSLPDIAPGATVSSNSNTTIVYIDSLLPNPEYFNLTAEITVNGQLFWIDSIHVITTGIEEEFSTPKNFTLSQNYPNPFNPTTKIYYSIPTQSKVIIKVYDILGNEIETLVNEEKSAGTYELTWDAANLPSGVYFYQLRTMPIGRQAGGFIATKKMVLLR